MLKFRPPLHPPQLNITHEKRKNNSLKGHTDHLSKMVAHPRRSRRGTFFVAALRRRPVAAVEQISPNQCPRGPVNGAVLVAFTRPAGTRRVSFIFPSGPHGCPNTLADVAATVGGACGGWRTCPGTSAPGSLFFVVLQTANHNTQNITTIITLRRTETCNRNLVGKQRVPRLRIMEGPLTA